jgi:hypothetical protein
MSQAFPRKKRRLIVEYVDDAGVKRTAFTRDLSLTGFFVAAETCPKVGETVSVDLHLPRGTIAPLKGTVVRSGRSSSAGSGSISIGFAFALSEFSEDYARLIQTLV